MSVRDPPAAPDPACPQSLPTRAVPEEKRHTRKMRGLPGQRQRLRKQGPRGVGSDEVTDLPLLPGSSRRNTLDRVQE